MNAECILAILPRGEADRVMSEAKKAGAQGGTILLARGTGSHEAKTFFGLAVESGREILMIICDQDKTDNILNALIEAGNLKEPGAGIAFSFPLNKIVGLKHRMGIETAD